MSLLMLDTVKKLNKLLIDTVAVTAVGLKTI